MSIVFTEDQGPVRHIVLNRPEKRNAMNQELLLRARRGPARRPRPRNRSTASCCAGKGPSSPPASTSAS